MADFQAEFGPAQFEAGIGWIGGQALQSTADNLTASTVHSQSAPFLQAQCNRFITVASAGDACTLPPSLKTSDLDDAREDGHIEKAIDHGGPPFRNKG